MWVKEKLLITSNFSFSHSVFKRLVSQGHQKMSLCGNGLRRDVLLEQWSLNSELLIEVVSNTGLPVDY